jgi:hypothetical protein
MKRDDLLVWLAIFSLVGGGYYAFCHAICLVWYSTTPLISSDLQQKALDYGLLWLGGFLLCVGGASFLFFRRRALLKRFTEKDLPEP